MAPETEQIKFSDLRKRVESAAVLILFCLAIGAWALFSCFGNFVIVALITGVLTICAWELAMICGAGQDGTKSRMRVGYFALSAFAPILTAAYIAQALFRSPTCYLQIELLAALAIALLSFVISFLGAVLLIVVEGRSDIEHASQISRELPLGLFLVGLCGALVLTLCGHPSAPWLLLWLLLVVCVNDAAAYFVGSKVGGPRLAQAISPKKTISGSIAGLVAGVLVGLASYWLLPVKINPLQVLILSIALVLAAQLGDLTKSYLKRLHAVKDSGNIIPGHGGLLDRVDGILTAGALLGAWLCTRPYLLG